MPLLTPEAIAAQRLSESGFAVLQDEITGEKASSLGHHGRQVEKALAALRAFDPGRGSAEDRLALVQKAAREVWAFLVQRELCGLRDQKEIIRHYDIPGEVLVRLGAVEPNQK